MINRNTISTPLHVLNPESKATGIGGMYLRIFNLYLDMYARDKALIYGQKALFHYERINDQETLSYILERLGELYDFFDKYEKALNCYNKCALLKKDQAGLKK